MHILPSLPQSNSVWGSQPILGSPKGIIHEGGEKKDVYFLVPEDKKAWFEKKTHSSTISTVTFSERPFDYNACNCNCKTLLFCIVKSRIT